MKGLNRDKTPTPSDMMGKKYLAKKHRDTGAGKLWSSQTVRRLLQHHAVYGTHVPKTLGPNAKLKNKVQSGDAVENYFPQIISKTEFNSVQDAMNKRSTNTGPRGKTLHNLFQGIIYICST